MTRHRDDLEVNLKKMQLIRQYKASKRSAATTRFTRIAIGEREKANEVSLVDLIKYLQLLQTKFSHINL